MDDALLVGVVDGAGKGLDQLGGLARRLRVVVQLLRQVAAGDVLHGEEGLAAVLADLERQHPGVRARLMDDGGQLRRFVNVYLNDEDVRFLGGLETEVSDGDSVTILPAVAGG